MKKSEVRDLLSARNCYGSGDKRLNKAQLKEMVDLLFNHLSTSIATGRRVEIRGFGNFSLKARSVGKIRNPRHGVTLNSSARHVVYFRAGKSLARRVNSIYETE